MLTREKQPTKRHSAKAPKEVENLRNELRLEKLARQALERRVEELLQVMRNRDAFYQSEIQKLKKDVADRDEKLESANKQLEWFRKTFFDKKSEEHPDLTDEEDPNVSPANAELKADDFSNEQGTRKRGQQKGSKGHGRTDVSQLQTENQPLEIKNCSCKKCGIAYRQLERTEDSPLIEMFTVLLLMNYQRRIYVPNCKCEGGEIRTAPAPEKLFNRTKLGNSLWVHLIVQKFLFGAPTNRTLKAFSLRGFDLAQGTVTGGFKKIDQMLQPLYNGIVDHCRGGELWNGDETTWRVFGSGEQKWWLWLVASDDAVVYILDETRSSSVPDEFFAGSLGILMTDRYSAYKGLHDGISKAWCWIHVRRDFLRIFDGIKKLKSWAKKWLEEIARLFVLNQIRFKIWSSGHAYGESWTEAQSRLADHLQQMERHWQSEVSQIGLHKEQKTALNSLKRHWPGLTMFIRDPRIPLHNNRAERLLRNPVVLRKNSYGSGSKWSGEFASKMFSIFQTWLVNNLDPEALLLDFFDQASAPGRPPPKLDQFLPWQMSPERKQAFALPKSYKRPG